MYDIISCSDDVTGCYGEGWIVTIKHNAKLLSKILIWFFFMKYGVHCAKFDCIKYVVAQSFSIQSICVTKGKFLATILKNDGPWTSFKDLYT